MTSSPTAGADRAAMPPTHTTATGRAAVVAIAVVLIAAFMDLLDATIVSVAAPAIAEDLGASRGGTSVDARRVRARDRRGLITGGRIGDQFGRRRVFLLGLAAFALASAGCALAPSSEVLIATRVAQGLAGGLMVPQVFGIIRSSLGPDTRGKAFGAYGAVLGLASVAGPLLGGLLVEADLFGLGWRTIFWVNIPVAVAGLVLGARFLPESRAPDGARLDLPGAVLAAAAAMLVLLPLVQGRDWGWPWWGFVLLALSVPTMALFFGGNGDSSHAAGSRSSTRHSCACGRSPAAYPPRSCSSGRSAPSSCCCPLPSARHRPVGARHRPCHPAVRRRLDHHLRRRGRARRPRRPRPPGERFTRPRRIPGTPTGDRLGRRRPIVLGARRTIVRRWSRPRPRSSPS